MMVRSGYNAAQDLSCVRMFIREAAWSFVLYDQVHGVFDHVIYDRYGLVGGAAGIIPANCTN